METELRMERQRKRLAEYKKNLQTECLKQRETVLRFPYQSKRETEIQPPNWKIQPFPHRMRWLNLK